MSARAKIWVNLSSWDVPLSWDVSCSQHGLIADGVTALPQAKTIAANHNLGHEQKEARMRTEKQITSEIEGLNKRISTLLKEREQVRSLPPEPADGAAIRFDVQFTESDTKYTYLALHIGYHWYTTAVDQERKVLSWKDLVGLMREDVDSKDGDVSWAVLRVSHVDGVRGGQDPLPF